MSCHGEADLGSRDAIMRGAGSPYNVLMLSDKFRFAYRILRSFNAAGANVHVLGGRTRADCVSLGFAPPFARGLTITTGIWSR